MQYAWSIWNLEPRHHQSEALWIVFNWVFFLVVRTLIKWLNGPISISVNCIWRVLSSYGGTCFNVNGIFVISYSTFGIFTLVSLRRGISKGGWEILARSLMANFISIMVLHSHPTNSESLDMEENLLVTCMFPLHPSPWPFTPLMFPF